MSELNYKSLDLFGQDVKAMRKTLGLSRRELSEKLHIGSRYLANIENSASLPSLTVFYELVKICNLSVDRYFYPEQQSDADNPVVAHIVRKLHLCPAEYLHIIDATLDAVLKLKPSDE